MQLPFHRQDRQELSLQEGQQPTIVQHQQQFPKPSQHPHQRQQQLDRRKQEHCGESNAPSKGSRGGNCGSNSANPAFKTPPWAYSPVLQPPAAAGLSQRRHVLTFGSRRNTDGKSVAKSAADPLKVTVLGAGQDVGRSAVYVRRGERGLLFDCGSHLGAKQARKMPVLNMLLQLAPQQDAKQGPQTMEEALLQPSPLFACCVDAAVISHFHMDHCGSLPSFTERLGYRNPIAMTFPTRALSPVLLLDSARIFKEASFRGRLHEDPGEGNDRDICVGGSTTSSEGRAGGAPGAPQEQWNYTEAEAQRCMRRCMALRLHESWRTGAWTATPYYAGHVLGAAMLLAQLPGGHSIVYTGDFNTSPDRHLGSACIPRLRPDLLISECTYGSFGKVLIPVFAVGRAQELCMLLNSYWQRMQLQYPIYFGGGMTEKANKYYKLYVQWTGSDMVHRLDGANNQQSNFADHVEEDEPSGSALGFGEFDFQHISTLPPEVLTSPTPMVLLATPGMLHGGLALKALKLWAGGPENLVLLPGYCVRGTIGAMLIDAHADTTGIQQLARHLQPKAVMLVHGEKEGMLKLARVLQRELGVPVHTPPTGQTVSVPVDRVEHRVPVYIHARCFRRYAATPHNVSLAVSARTETLWESNDPTLTALLRSPAVRRYLPQPSASPLPPPYSAISPYFFPPSSLFFFISSVARKSLLDSPIEERAPADDVFLLVDFENLVLAAIGVTMNGCGSIKHYANSNKMLTPADSSGPASMGENELVGGAEIELKRRNKTEFPRSAVIGKTTGAGGVLPRCIQLVALRYQHEVQLEASTFQQLLHLFLDYVVQCRQAYDQQRLQCGLVPGKEHPPALDTPEFCNFGEHLGLKELEGGGILIEFLSLIAIHDGRDRLRMQWSDADERRPGAVSVFVEYFSSLEGICANASVDARPSLAA
ncbi:RNA-metabolising metallo-beta-lactamase domain-containing protein, putative [Eimeria mitis]|uniref:RNA-metabolising metallo-beta-lactamase domain-containing protein, putative n=1 Tax=Eimeria mitis TaxID=44415 RepID=U6JU66_9EIME|nr:RNA-metabolising metallo-beta-lactamase domain-containing protein, putative [Eimeria mitis]CDJ27068.1 RNA-metabolising metallo-beta-lactamase domain-containing protein, putative [Eimeria mitis]